MLPWPSGLHTNHSTNIDAAQEVSLPFMLGEIESVRRMDDHEVDEEFWEKEVEEADFMGRDSCLVM